MASRTPFLTVECGNAAEIAAWSGGGVVIPTDKFSNGFARGKLKPMARAIKDSINEPERRARLAAKGWRAWQERFTWETIALQYEQLYRSTITATLARQAL
jgi:glycosyltransferase involved in cell wall biosynthesis